MRLNFLFLPFFIVSALLAVLPLQAQTAALPTEPTTTNVVWNTPSDDWNGSVPLGNGEVGVNAWFNAAGELEMFLSRTDAWDDYGRLVKVGGVKITLFDDTQEPNPKALHPFESVLDASTGTLTAKLGAKNREARVAVWVDAHRPVVVVEIDAEVYLTPKATLALWRTEPPEIIEKPEVSDLFWKKEAAKGGANPGDAAEAVPLVGTPVVPDTIITSDALEAAKMIGWYHANHKTPYFDEIAKTQGLDDFPGLKDPFEGRTFGAIVSAASPVYKNERTLYSAVGLKHRFEIAVTCFQPATPEEWTTQTLAALTEAAAVAVDSRRAAHTLWWSEFDARSYLRFTPRKGFQKPPLPESTLFTASERPLAIGVDQSGEERFRGTLSNFNLYALPLTGAQAERVAAYYRLDKDDIAALINYIALTDDEIQDLAAYYKLTAAEIAELQKEFTPSERKLFELTKLFTLRDITILQTLKNFTAIVPYFHYEKPGHNLLFQSRLWEFPDGFSAEISFRPDKVPASESDADAAPDEPQRLFDKMSPGGSDGFALDITPDKKLRLLTRGRVDLFDVKIIPGKWNHVILTVHPNDRIQLYFNGVETLSDRQCQAVDGEETFVVSRAYALQRYLDACAGRGNYPIKFNGSIFTVPAVDPVLAKRADEAKDDPDAPAVAKTTYPGFADYRRWGPGYWWQNSRLPYFSKPMAGDFDLMLPFFKMYASLLPLNVHRTKKYLGHAGAYYPECLYFWGAVFPETYGTQLWSERENKLQETGWHKYEWVGGLELVYLMLAYYEYKQDDAFLAETLLPTATEILTFFDQHYKTDETTGKLIMTPAQALETWWDCLNPMPEIAGLHAVTAKLLALPPEKTTDVQRAFWTAFAAKIPSPPTRVDELTGETILAPAERFAEKRNIENPELYAVFPFRLYAFEKPDYRQALGALLRRENPDCFGWRQDELFMTYLGQSTMAREYLVERARNKDKDARFPVFWGPNYDWTPDQDHGGILTAALQSVVMQIDGDDIYLLPALPPEWDVEFKLHAPKNTVVEGKTLRGKITTLTVTPAERRKDVHIPRPPKSPRF